MTGVILAGGQNRRMNGQPKALLLFHGETLLQRQVREMKKVCHEILFVTNRPSLYWSFLPDDVRILTDKIPHQGPLGGMHAAFAHAKHEQVWVVACDMPFISSRAARLLAQYQQKGSCDAAIPLINDKIHPLHGIYHQRCEKLIAQVLDRGERKVMQFLKQVDWKQIPASFFKEKGLDLRFVMNVNTPEDYQQALMQI
ncbi:molybdopterin-guanine dinucleotide biosynthesis protein A [Thermoflavimicrobium dichotomicum]|uniref:Probable molybdenum cofactor guanylyltransferase n=2 Tax=Thermoflavimicrobium dichotomicum TaxID=46223 RepID=A0A1I3SYG4_9BACL|nr:molybdopterin-guanine dinucleotide biosynthesis protein A [Thermoflavimicrobium dichotomicum]